jgi:pyruvate dehydrogenase E1 component
VRGNGNIIDELEAAFRGAGWNVIKVIWGCEWDPLIARDKSGLLVTRMGEIVDGERQSFAIKGGAYIRKAFFGKYPELLQLVADISDDALARMRLGGHDPQKVYNAYKRAVEHRGSPTVVLARTVKGFGVGSAEARNATHQEKKLTDKDLTAFRARFEIPIPEQAAHDGTPFRPPDGSPEITYIQERRQQLGGYLPSRESRPFQFEAPHLEDFAEWLAGSQDRPVSTTMGFVSMLRHLLKGPKIGKFVIPIIPDEARTFGMEPIIRQVGIYASQGQKYEPYDKGMLLYYREEKDGQMLEEGITEAGSMGSFMAAGTAYTNYHVPMIPFFSFYSMFGFQRVGDLIWAFADARGKGFLLGATAGRTTLSGEGLQHQDGHSLVLATTVPTCASYDPAFVYELAVIIQDGLRRMYQEREDLFYYITIYNEPYAMPQMPEDCREGILRGIYKYRPAPNGKAVVQLFGSGPILNEALRAQHILAEKYVVQADVWSVTSYNQLRREALATERWNRLHPSQPERRPYILTALQEAEGPIIATTDYMKAVPDQLSPWLDGRLVSLGTDGFGRSDNREFLRSHFEVNAESIAAAALSRLAREGKFDVGRAQRAFEELRVNTEATDPVLA